MTHFGEIDAVGQVGGDSERWHACQCGTALECIEVLSPEIHIVYVCPECAAMACPEGSA